METLAIRHLDQPSGVGRLFPSEAVLARPSQRAKGHVKTERPRPGAVGHPVARPSNSSPVQPFAGEVRGRTLEVGHLPVTE
jgi:hypothetical protein